MQLDDVATSIQEKNENIYWILACIILVGMFFYMGWAFTSQIPSADEMVFFRVTKRLPAYESHKEWYTLDGVTDPNTILKPTPLYAANYDVPVWLNQPLDNYLSYPLVLMLFNENSIPEIRSSVVRFRIIALMVYWFCIILMLYLIRKRTPSNKVLFYSTLPLLATIPFFTEWHGDNWYYYDMFTYLFLCIAILMRKTKYEKFIYIPLIMMCASKLVGFLFLIPFAIENRKVLFCSLAVIPYLIQCWVVTGDPMYIGHIWFTHESMSPLEWSIVEHPFISFFLNRLWYVIVSLKKCWLLMITVLIPFIIYFRNHSMRIKENWFYPVLLIMACIYGLSLEAFYYHFLVIMIIGVLITGMAMAKRLENNRYA